MLDSRASDVHPIGRRNGLRGVRILRPVVTACSGSAGILLALTQEGQAVLGLQKKAKSRRDPSAALRTSAGATEPPASTCWSFREIESPPDNSSRVFCGLAKGARR